MYKERLARLAEGLNRGEMVVLFAGKTPESTADSRYKLRTNKSFFYFTGLGAEDYKVVVSVTDKGAEYKLFIEEPLFDIEKWVGKKLTKEQAAEISGIEDVAYLQDFEAYVGARIIDGLASTVYFDFERYHWNDEARMEEKFAKVLSDKFPHVDIKNIHHRIGKMRGVKDAHEIEQMREVIRITNIGVRKLYETVEPGMNEYDLEAEFFKQIMQNGASDVSFETIVASGQNATMLHYVDNKSELKDGDLVLTDLGALYGEYCADISRTFPINGKFTERQKELYNIVLKAQEDILKVMKPGVHFSELNKTARKSLLESLKKIGLASTDEELSKYYFHSCGHHLGLDVHDLGGRDVILEEGMIITNEPGVYIAEEGIGIRIEDDVLITADGAEVLSADIPKQIDEIEAIMAAAKK